MKTAEQTHNTVVLLPLTVVYFLFLYLLRILIALVFKTIIYDNQRNVIYVTQEYLQYAWPSKL